MKIDPRHLEIVAAIVDSGGLTEGAEMLGKSQPSLSRTLSQLEVRLNAPLFHPGKRPLRPTELGEALAEQGRKVRDAGMVATDVARRYRSGHAGLVRVAGSPVFMDGVVTTMLAEFQRHTPDVRVDQSYGYAQDLIAQLRNGTLDIAFCPLRNDEMPDDIVFQRILPGLNVIACRVGHPLARKGAIKLSDIAQFPWIAPPPDSPLFRDLRRAMSSIGVDNFQVSFSGGSLSSVVSILAGSDALTVLPYSVMFLQRRQKVLTELPLKIDHPDRTLGILSPRHDQIKPAAVRLQSFVASQFQHLAHTILQHQQNAVWRGGER